MSRMTPRLRARDVGELALSGVRSRPLRAGLSALGIAIGVAAIVAVLGISTSAQANLMRQLDALGTNLLRAAADEGFGFSEQATLPEEAEQSVRNIDPVESVSSVAQLSASVLRSDLVDSGETGGIGVYAASPDVLGVLEGSMVDGRFIDDALGKYPAVVLGATAAEQLGITDVDGGVTAWIGDQRFLVVGIMDTLPLAPELDWGVLMGYDVAAEVLEHTGEPTTLYIRADKDYVSEVRDVLPAQVNPEHPDEVAVSRPSDALAAQAATEEAFTGLLLGLGAVSLLVGGVGIANVMVMGVLERRGEIGLRRALGATRAHVRRQFLGESVVMAGIGGVAGVVLGGIVTAGYAWSRDLPAVVPAEAIFGGAAVALLLGAIAGLYPAVRAARLSPVEALRTT